MMTATDFPPKLLTEAQAAEILGIKPQTLTVWRCTRRHELPHIKVGRAVRYRLSDLMTWLDERTTGGRKSDE